jgi:hypothetical protein
MTWIAPTDTKHFLSISIHMVQVCHLSSKVEDFGGLLHTRLLTQCFEVVPLHSLSSCGIDFYQKAKYQKPIDFVDSDSDD